MKTHEYLGVSQTPTESDFEAVEAMYGFRLPTDYKAHLQQHNGGWIRGGAMFLQPVTDGSPALKGGYATLNLYVTERAR